jgi:LysM repeat protein
MFERTASRRRFLAGIAGGAAAVGLRPLVHASGIMPAARAASAPYTPNAARFGGALPTSHLAWVWQFNQDGEPERIREILAAHGLGVSVKTHDGLEWMAKYDTSRNAVSGPQRIAQLASFFEAGGVPFHAWCVVHGVDAPREAAMAASVLQAGARSLSIDLESYAGFWRGTQVQALQYTGMLRQAQPDATVMITIDARPWEIDRIPLKEFAAAANAIAPQVYWSDFGTTPNLVKYRLAGADPGAAGVTPLFALDTAARKISSLGLPIHPIGSGLITDTGAWGQFINESYARDAESLSVWRLGTTSPGVLELLKATPTRPRSYTVRLGDTASRLAGVWNTSVEEIAAANSLTNVNLLVVGQVLTIPRGAGALISVPSVSAAASVTPGGGTYVIQPGDSIGALAVRWNTTSARITAVNGLANANLIVVGQTLRIP